MLRRPIFVILGIVFILFVFGWIIFSIDWGGSTSQEERIEKEVKISELADTDASVRLQMNGAINSNKEHRQIWITVNNQFASIDVLRGYEGDVLKSKTFSNNTDSFTKFLAALEDSNFDKTRDYRGGQTEIGACPLGKRYIFEAFEPGAEEQIKHSWTTSCSNKIGTFDGKLNTTIRLFQSQIPDYNKFVSDIRLN